MWPNSQGVYPPTSSGEESTPHPPKWGAKEKICLKVPQMGDLGG